jgi:hypothetical protein
LKAIESKRNKGGTAYAAGKTLIVLLLASGGPWSPNKVTCQLPDQLNFDAVWVVGLRDINEGQYNYAVTRLDVSRGKAPIWVVHISKDFDSWKVEPLLTIVFSDASSRPCSRFQLMNLPAAAPPVGISAIALPSLRRAHLPGDEAVRLCAERGCAFWTREPGSET